MYVCVVCKANEHYHIVFYFFLINIHIVFFIFIFVHRAQEPDFIMRVDTIQIDTYINHY